MTTMDAEVFDAFRSIGIADDKAMSAAQALGQREPDILGLKNDFVSLKSDAGILKADVALLKWMLGFVFAGVLTVVLKAFIH